MNVYEIEDHLLLLNEEYSNLSKIIELRYESIEGRKIHAIIIGKNKEDKLKESIFFTGGVHGREWGGSDICAYFASDILEAYTKGTGLRYGNQYFNASHIKRIVDELNLIILPDVNPDGKAFSQSNPWNQLWRGNRNLGVEEHNSECFGVDLNRNYDLLWDYKKYFAPDADVHTSEDPCDDMQTYKGKSPFSEPETNNVKNIFDMYTGIKYYIDIHCAVGAIYYCWGIDHNQTDNPEMNLTNSSYNNIRGKKTNEYKEYIPFNDLEYIKSLANSFNEALKNVRGTKYQVGQSYELYPTSGASDDYAYSRHTYDNLNKKIYGFTIEFGKKDFQPPWPEMKKIIIEVSSGLVGFCSSIIKNN